MRDIGWELSIAFLGFSNRSGSARLALSLKAYAYERRGKWRQFRSLR